MILLRSCLLVSPFCFMTLLCLAGGARAPLAQSPLLLVVNQGDATVALIDPISNRRITSIAEGVPKMVGHEVATSPDGRFAYVPLYGDAGVGKPGTDGDQMLVIDLTTRTIVNHVTFGRGVRPHCIVYDPVSGMLYVTTEITQSITIIDPHTLHIVGSIPTHQDQSHMLVLSHDGRRGYTANVASGTVSVLDLKQRAFITSIPISKTTQRISISRDDKTVFTADQTTPRIALIDTATNQVTARIPIPTIGYGNVPTMDGRELLVAMPSTDQLAVIDLKSRKVSHVVDVGPHPQAVFVRPDGKAAYVSCYGGRQVTVVNTATWKVDAMIDSGEKADGLAWAPGPSTTQ